MVTAGVVLSRRLPSGQVQVTAEGQRRAVAARKEFGREAEVRRLRKEAGVPIAEDKPGVSKEKFVTGFGSRGQPQFSTISPPKGTQFFLTPKGTVTFRPEGAATPEGSVRISKNLFEGIKKGVKTGKVKSKQLVGISEQIVSPGLQKPVLLKEKKSSLRKDIDFLRFDTPIITGEGEIALGLTKAGRPIITTKPTVKEKKQIFQTFTTLAEPKAKDIFATARKRVAEIRPDGDPLTSGELGFFALQTGSGASSQISIVEEQKENNKKIQDRIDASNAGISGFLKRSGEKIDSLNEKLGKSQILNIPKITIDFEDQQRLSTVKLTKELKLFDKVIIPEVTVENLFQKIGLEKATDFFAEDIFVGGKPKFDITTFKSPTVKETFVPLGEAILEIGQQESAFDKRIREDREKFFKEQGITQKIEESKFAPTIKAVSFFTVAGPQEKAKFGVKTLGGAFISAGEKPATTVATAALGFATGGILGGIGAVTGPAFATGTKVVGGVLGGAFVASKTAEAIGAKSEREFFTTVGGGLLEAGVFGISAQVGTKAAVGGLKFLAGKEPFFIKEFGFNTITGKGKVKITGKQLFREFSLEQIISPGKKVTTFTRTGRTFKIVQPKVGKATATLQIGAKIKPIKVPKISTEGINLIFKETQTSVLKDIAQQPGKSKIIPFKTTKLSGSGFLRELGIFTFKGKATVTKTRAFGVSPKGTQLPQAGKIPDFGVSIQATGGFKPGKIKPIFKTAVTVGAIGILAPKLGLAGVIVQPGDGFGGLGDPTSRFVPGRFKPVVPKVTAPKIVKIPKLTFAPKVSVPSQIEFGFGIPTGQGFVAGGFFPKNIFGGIPTQFFKPGSQPLPKLIDSNQIRDLTIGFQPIKTKPVGETKPFDVFKTTQIPGIDPGVVPGLVPGFIPGFQPGIEPTPGTDFVPDFVPPPDFVPEFEIPEIPIPIVPGFVPGFLPKGFAGGRRGKRKKKLPRRSFKFTKTLFAPQGVGKRKIVDPLTTKFTGFEFRV